MPRLLSLPQSRIFRIFQLGCRIRRFTFTNGFEELSQSRSGENMGRAKSINDTLAQFTTSSN